MFLRLSTVIALFGALLVAARPPLPPYASDAGSSDHDGQCRSFNLPISVNTTGLNFGVSPITNKYETVQWTVNSSTWSTPSISEILPSLPNINIEGTFNIHGHLCIPRQGAKKDILHLATHGIAFDSRYWDVSIDPKQYSYVYNTLRAGYSILTYDRLTTGLSSKPNGYITAQGATEVAILRQLTLIVRSGEIFNHVEGLSEMAFISVVHVGHSFGSSITNGFLALDGALSDGAILTGFIPNNHPKVGPASLSLDFARTNDPKFADRPNAYIVPARDIDMQTGFFSTLANTTLDIGGFDPALLELANSTKQPSTVAEFISSPLLGFIYGPATEFKGPIQFMEAEYDYLICGGDCHDWNQTAIDTTFANAKDMEVYLQPGTGHGLALHRNASIGYQVTYDFLDRNGL